MGTRDTWHDAIMGEALEQYTVTRSESARQWGRVLGRARPQKGKRQENYLPVEVVTVLALLTVVDPSTQGWGTYDPQLETVAALCRRSPGSIAEKERNLDGTRQNAGVGERELFRAVVADPILFFELWEPVLQGARDAGIGPDRLPDLLDLTTGGFIGQEPLVGDWETYLHAEVEGYLKAGLDGETSERAAVTMARVGQHRFARRVRDAYGSRCGFCGFDASGLPGTRLLIASHIKPWRDSASRERGDVRNGIAACPSHDAAFDSGLLTVTADGTIHTARVLRDVSVEHPSVVASLSGSARPELLRPDDRADHPSPRYLDWHHSQIWRNGVSALTDPVILAAEDRAGFDARPLADDE